MIHFYKIDKNGLYQDLYLLDSTPSVEIEGELIPDPSYISTPIPNDVYVDLEAPPKWDGEKWVATGEPPEPIPLPPTEIEKLEAKITAANDYTDFLEEVIVEMALVVYG